MFVEIIGIYLGMSILALCLLGGASVFIFTILNNLHKKKKKPKNKAKNEPKIDKGETL